MQWSRQELLVAFALYCRIPFGKFHQRNPDLIQYAKLLGRTPSALAMKLSNIASIDPAFIASGRSGLTGASVADKEMWKEMEGSWEQFVLESENALNSLGQSFSSGLEKQTSLEYSATDKIVNVKVRVGQDFFRRAVLSAYDDKCCITGLAIPQLLVASHIKPWRVDQQNRLNPRNGLALSALHDKAFDLGIITIDENLKVCVTKKMGDLKDVYFKDSLLAFEGKQITNAGKFQPQDEFLSYHRTEIYEKTAVFK